MTGQDGTLVNSGYMIAMYTGLNWELNISGYAKIKEHIPSAGPPESRGEQRGGLPIGGPGD